MNETAIKLGQIIDYVNRIYNPGFNVDFYDGVYLITSLSQTLVNFSGTATECIAWLEGWQDAARLMENRHNLNYGMFDIMRG